MTPPLVTSTRRALVIAGWAACVWAVITPASFAQGGEVEARGLAPDDDAGAAAREAVARATARFEAEDYAAASLEFERAYRLLEPGPKRHAVLNNLAVCHQRMLHHVRAVELYERYLREADPLPADRAEVERIVTGLRELIGEVHVTSNVPAEVWIDEQARGRTPLSLQLPAGEHVLELRAAGHESGRTGFTVVPRERVQVELALQEREVYRGVSRTYFFSGVALSSATLLVGSALAGRALGLHREGQANLDVHTTADEQKIRRLQISADVLFASGALVATATLVLAFVTNFEREPEARGGLELALAPDRGGASVWLRGRF